MIKHILTLIWNKKKSNFLLFLEIFISFLILFSVLTFVVRNLRIYNSPLGFESKNVWNAYLRISSDIDSTDVAEMKSRIHRELLAFPEVEHVSFSSGQVPFSGNTWMTGNDEHGIEFSTCVFFKDDHYANVSDLKISEGRWFNEDDINSKYDVVLITKKFREKCFKGKPVIDSLFVLDDDGDFTDFVKIVGVVENYKYHGEFEEELLGTFVYAPSTSRDTYVANIKVKEGTSPNTEEKINNLIASITKRADFSIRKQEQRRIQRSKSTWTSMIAIMSVSGFLIINVALGLFGVLWYNISKRRSEIGLRRTLGATQGNIANQFIAEILMVTIVGILVGLFFAAQFPIMKLFELENINYYYAMLLASGIIILLVLICAFYPSRQAALIKPAIALHED